MNNKNNDNEGSHFIPGIFGDEFCVTHVIPYYRNYLGSGLEDLSAQRLLAHIRNPHK